MVRGEGLTDDGQYFRAGAEEAGSAEQRLLSDPRSVEKLQGVILDALARFGPLTDRQLIRSTGLSQACVAPFLNGPLSLFAAFPGVVIQREDGSISLNRATDRWRRREALLAEIRTLLHRAFQEAAQLRPAILRAQKLYLTGSEPADLAGRSERGLRDAERIAELLHRAVGPHQTAWKLSQPDAALDRDLVDQAATMLREVVGPLSLSQLYGALQAPPVTIDPENLLQAVLDFAGESSQLDRWAAIAEALDSLHGLSDQELASDDRREEAKLPPVPDAAELRATRRDQEEQLRTSEDWSRYLEREYPLPAALREKLKTLTVGLAGEIVGSLELDLSPHVLEGVKQYLAAVIELEEKGREALGSRLVQLATEAARESKEPSKHRDIEFVAGLLDVPPTGLLDS